MRIALATRHHDPSFMPLALLYLKAALVDARCVDAADVAVLEFGPADDAERIADAIVDAEPDLVGLSCYVWNVTALLGAARAIKARRPGVRVVLGGPEVGPVAEDVLARNPHVDAVVRSEGERPFAAIVGAVAGGSGLNGVPGLVVRDGDGIVETPDAPVVRDLDDVASPHFTWESWTGRTVCVETQRGCVFRCGFCFYNKDYSVRNRRFSLDRVKDEIGLWLDRDVAELYLMDPVFNLNAARAKEICRFIAERNHRRIPVHAEIWAEFVDDELAGLMAAANFTFVEVGLQTTDTTALVTSERRLKMQPFLDGVHHLKRHRVPFEVQLIAGLPGETRATFRESVNFAARLDPDYLAIFPLMVLPGTEFWRRAGALGIVFAPEPPYHVIATASMDRADVAYACGIAAACEALQASRTIRLLSRERGLSFVDLLESWMAWGSDGQPDEPPAARVQRFVSRVCRERGIPQDFYRAAAHLEFA